MRKVTVVLGASTMGAASILMTSAPAYAADPVVDDCSNQTQHSVGGTVAANWYMDCVPQFGAGKAEFDIADDDFTDVNSLVASGADSTDFVALDDPSVSVTTDLDTTAAYAYGMADSFDHGAFSALTADPDGDTATTRHYSGILVAPVTGVRAASASELAACGDPADFTEFFAISFGAVTTTFTEGGGATERSYVVTVPAHTKYVAFSLDSGDVDTDVPSCATDGTHTVRVEGTFFPESLTLIQPEITYVPSRTNALTVSPIVSGSVSDGPVGGYLGVFGRYVAPVPTAPTGDGAGSGTAPVPAVVPAAALPDTGAPVLPLVVSAGGMLAAGLGIMSLAVSRRRRAKPAHTR